MLLTRMTAASWVGSAQFSLTLDLILIHMTAVGRYPSHLLPILGHCLKTRSTAFFHKLVHQLTHPIAHFFMAGLGTFATKCYGITKSDAIGGRCSVFVTSFIWRPCCRVAQRQTRRIATLSDICTLPRQSHDG